MSGRKIPTSPASKAKKIAEGTMEAVEALKYKTGSGRTISIDKFVTPAVRRSKLYKPDVEITIPVDSLVADSDNLPGISVTRESTLEAAARLEDENPCVLNFASAKNPGGGFLRGSLAQEESIARSSALYHTLIQHPEYYEENKRAQKDNIGLYLNYAIYSPDVPIIRNDRGDWLEDLYTTSVVTSPAPNRGAIFNDWDAPPVGDPERDKFYEGVEEKINETFRGRMRQVLAIMAENGHKTIVLGAWGCGVFGNDPWVVAKMFKEVLAETPCFFRVVFAIYDAPDSDVYRAFEKVFS